MVLEVSTGATAISEDAGWSRLIRPLTAACDPRSLFNRICRDVAEGFGFSRETALEDLEAGVAVQFIIPFGTAPIRAPSC